MAQMPKWIAGFIEKGSSVKDCLEMWHQEQEAMRTYRAFARAEREAVSTWFTPRTKFFATTK